MDIDEKVYETLKMLEIPYEKFEHPPINTVEDGINYWKDIPSVHCKNLFLRNYKGTQHYLVVLEHLKRFDMKELNKQFGNERFGFASPERLAKYLGVRPGSVSPFGLINDKENHVIAYIDSELQHAEYLSFHPNINTISLKIKGTDFLRYLNWVGNNYSFRQIN
jgi:Ala-tRNA(Pro) deacylase